MYCMLPEPFSGVPWSLITACVEKWLQVEQTQHWINSTGLEHSKKFIAGPNKTRSKILLKLNRKDLRLVTGFLTGHYRVRYKLKQWKIIRDDSCRFCCESPETTEYLLCDCEALESCFCQRVLCLRRTLRHIAVSFTSIGPRWA